MSERWACVQSFYMCCKNNLTFENHWGKINAQFRSVDACHAVTMENAALLGPRAAVQGELMRKVERVENSEQNLADPHSDPHYAALVLLILKWAMFLAVPNQGEHGFAFPRKIVSIGQDSHGNHYEEE